MEIVVVLYIVGIALIMGYLINRYPREALCDLWERGGAVHQGAVPPGLSTVSGHTP